MLIVSVLVCIMILYPIGTLVYKSFIVSERGSPLIYSLSNYVKIFTVDRYFLAIRNS